MTFRQVQAIEDQCFSVIKALNFTSENRWDKKPRSPDRQIKKIGAELKALLMEADCLQKHWVLDEKLSSAISHEMLIEKTSTTLD